MSGLLWAVLSGACFGAGLVISGMTDPEVVRAFLTLNANWNPALIAVMGSAVVVAGVGFALARRRARPIAAPQFHEPVATVIDSRLLIGSAIFGTGWALTGYCPGPAIVGAASLDYRALIFMGAYFVGLGIYQWLFNRAAAPVTALSSDG